jgi:hypothetical protein
MNHLKTFENYNPLNEGKPGIHFAIRNKLIDFLKHKPEASFKETQDYINSVQKDWKLSHDDYREAGGKEKKK